MAQLSWKLSTIICASSEIFLDSLGNTLLPLTQVSKGQRKSPQTPLGLLSYEDDLYS